MFKKTIVGFIVVLSFIVLLAAAPPQPGWSWSTYKTKVIVNIPPSTTGHPVSYDFNVD